MAAILVLSNKETTCVKMCLDVFWYFNPLVQVNCNIFLCQGSRYETVEILTNLAAKKIAIQKTSSEQEVEKEKFDISPVLS